MEIYTNTIYPKNENEVKMKIKIFRNDHDEVKITIINRFNNIESGGSFVMNSTQSREIVNILRNTDIDEILNKNTNIAEKYKLDNKQCPFYFNNNECKLSINYNCDRKNQFGYCDKNYGE